MVRKKLVVCRSKILTRERVVIRRARSQGSSAKHCTIRD